MTAPRADEIAETLQDRVRRKTSRRIVPFIFVLYIVSYLDRANVAFAKTTMSKALGFSEAVFGFGAGIFFIGYLLLEIPSAIIVEKWSARKWISRILLSWGICTVLVGFVHSAGQFYGARFLLGAAEAGFFPGILVYLTRWFPMQDRAKAISGLIMAAPISMALGGPLSAAMLNVHWFGLDGWRWLFILQGAPAILCGIITPFWLTDHPRDARWLSSDERNYLVTQAQEELERKPHKTAWKGMLGADTWRLAIVLFLANIAVYAFVLWLPQTIEHAANLSASAAAGWSVIPFGITAVSIWISGRYADRHRPWQKHAAGLLFAAALFFPLAHLQTLNPASTALFLCASAATIFAWPPPFWVLPTLSLGKVAAAASIGLINSIGNLGGFVGPWVVGALLTAGLPPWAAALPLCLGLALAGLLVIRVRVRSGSPRQAQS